MSDDRDGQAKGGVPDTDPRHIDPASDLADLFEAGEFDASIATDADREQLEEFVRRAEAGEFDADAGLEATVRIARALLNEDESGMGADGAREE